MAGEAENFRSNAEEIESLRRDMRELRNDLRHLADSLKSAGRKERLHDLRTRLEEIVENLRQETRKQFHEAYDSARERGQEAVAATRRQVSERPLTSLLVAFVAGLIFSRFLRR